MSHQEKMSYIKSISTAIENYTGFTSSEKKFAADNIHNWIDNTGSLSILIKKFSELSLDIRPFIKEQKLTTI